MAQKVIIQCNTFMKPDDFKRLAEDIKKNFEDGVLVLPVYCDLKAVLDAEDVELVEKEQ